MAAVPKSDIDQETLSIADIYTDMGKNPDPTGDFAAGRTHFHASSEEFLACLKSRLHESADD